MRETNNISSVQLFLNSFGSSLVFCLLIQKKQDGGGEFYDELLSEYIQPDDSGTARNITEKCGVSHHQILEDSPYRTERLFDFYSFLIKNIKAVLSYIGITEYNVYICYINNWVYSESALYVFDSAVFGQIISSPKLTSLLAFVRSKFVAGSIIWCFAAIV